MQRLRELACLVEAVFDDLEQTFSNYQSRTGLTCRAGCGACCNNPQVEATVLEMLPLALTLYDTGRAEQVLAELEQYAGFSCYHYNRHSLDGLSGDCSVYRQRPAICRMFGAAGVSNKHDHTRLSVCRVIKTDHADAWQAVQLVSGPEPVPKMTDGKARIRQLDYALGKMDLPINQALNAALEKILFISSFGEFDSAGQVA